jgi:uncharacterized protein YbbK (DUF523 family)/uncharacterized protein YbgA (DUF1722 family)
MNQPIRVGVSACLLGRPVRYDGSHKRDRYVTDTLGRHFEFVPVCPEVECGLGVPREPMRLAGAPGTPRLVTIKTGLDLTERLTAWARRRVEELAATELSGCIFKSKSPSCGLARVKVYGETGTPVPRGVGLFARAFLDRFPRLPVEEEGRLADEGRRENFIERLFTLARWRQALAGDGSTGLVARIVAFQTRHKLLLMAHSPGLARQMGRLVAEAAAWPADGLRQSYETMLMRTMALPATPAKQANVLHHALGHLKKVLTGPEKTELLESIDDHRRGLIPLLVPMTLLWHHVRTHAVTALQEQVYFRPHPLELKLRNHA